MSDSLDLVNEVVDPSHPSVIRGQLAKQVWKLLHEGMSRDLVSDALREWESKPGSPPSWLPHMASDAIRRRRAQVKEDQHRISLGNWEEQLKKELGG